MKRFSQIFLGLSVLVLLAGCAKDNYNKWLTSGTWNLSSFNLETKTVTVRTYTSSANVGSNYTSISDKTDVLSSGTETYTQTTTNQPNTGASSFNTDVTTTKNATTYAFDKSGTYTMTATTSGVSTQHTSTTHPTDPPVGNVTPAVTNTNKDDWSWQEDGSIKDQILINGFGIVMIKLTKSSMTLTYNPSTKQTSTGTDFVGDYTEEVTSTTTDTWTFGK